MVAARCLTPFPAFHCVCFLLPSPWSCPVPRFHYFLGRLEAKVRDSDPNAERMRAAITASRAVIDPYVDGDGFGVADGLALAAFGASGAYLLKRPWSCWLCL